MTKYILACMTHAVLFGCAASAASAGAAGEFTPRSFPIANADSFSFYSRTMQQRYDVSVSYPPDYAKNASKSYPALILTDGNLLFPLAHLISSSLTTQDDIDPPLIISVSGPIEEGLLSHKRRVREFYAPGWPLSDPFGQYLTQLCEKRYGIEVSRCLGGSPEFLKFLSTELLPSLQQRFRIDASDLGLAGVSAGGFFTLWTAFQAGTPFKKFIASGAALGYGDGRLLDLEEAYAGTHRDFPVAIYMASGSLELEDKFLEGIVRIGSGQIRLNAVLRSRSYPSLKLYSEIHQGFGHVDVAPATLARGIRLLYGKAPAARK